MARYEVDFALHNIAAARRSRRSWGLPVSAPARSKVSFTDKDRDVVRSTSRRVLRSAQTTGNTAKVVIRHGERLPDKAEVEEFPETVYLVGSFASRLPLYPSRKLDLSGLRHRFPSPLTYADVKRAIALRDFAIDLRHERKRPARCVLQYHNALNQPGKSGSIIGKKRNLGVCLKFLRRYRHPTREDRYEEISGSSNACRLRLYCTDSGCCGILRCSRRNDKKVHRGRHEADHDNYDHRRQWDLQNEDRSRVGHENHEGVHGITLFGRRRLRRLLLCCLRNLDVHPPF